MRIYTRGGDDGTTGLLYGGRVDKSDPRTEAYGTTDEAVAALGTARENAHKLRPGTTKVTAAMVEELERHIDEYTARIRMPEEFIVPGETQGSSFLDFARTVIRRAERHTV